MWSTNDCPYIVRCHGYFTNFDLAGIVMEYMEYGTLFELLHHQPRIEIPIELKIRFAQNITMVIDYLHNIRQDQRFIHGDIKTLNILLDRFLVAKISDFGGCKLRTVTKDNLNHGKRGRDLRPGERNVFTIQYTAPEMLLNPGTQPTAAADMYSCGVVLWEIYTGDVPYKHYRSIYKLESDICRNKAKLEIPHDDVGY
ncbi:dual specificity protein kinase shkC-like [Ciona intestinalis]